jgi:N-acetylmuramoyl-L-alanine amidase
MISYEKDLVIRQTYCNGFIRSKPVKYIVVHGTGGGSSAQRLLKWMRKPGQAQQNRYKRGIALFHYLIGREGEIIEIIDPSRWVYHSSIGRMDAGTIGIELVNPSRDNSTGYTDAQYESLVNMVEFLRQDFSVDKIISHRFAKEVLGKGKTKNCPGNFDWEKFTMSLKQYSATRTAHDCIILNS